MSSQPLVILISGTSRGLGAHLRVALEAAGHIVYGSSRNGGADPRTLALDVVDPASCEAAVATVLDAEGRLDVLINNAGSHHFGAAVETSEAELRAQMELNFHGAVHLTRAALPTMLEAGRGRILCMSSTNGRFATPFAGAYAASKFALEGYMEALRYEVAPAGIYVTLLEPAFLATGTHDSSIGSAQAEHPRFAEARRAVEARASADAANGLPLERVSAAIEQLLGQAAPPLRVTVDGLATRLGFLRTLLPAAWFERAVTKQIAPELLAE